MGNTNEATVKSFTGEVVTLLYRVNERSSYPTNDIEADVELVSRSGANNTQLPTADIEVASTTDDTYASPANTSAIAFSGAGREKILQFKYTNTTPEMVLLKFTLSSTNYSEADDAIALVVLTKKSDVEGDLTTIRTDLSAVKTTTDTTQNTVNDIKTEVENESGFLGG